MAAFRSWRPRSRIHSQNLPEVRPSQSCDRISCRIEEQDFPPKKPQGRDGRVAEGARLESVFTRKGNVGSNPTLSAITFFRVTPGRVMRNVRTVSCTA